MLLNCRRRFWSTLGWDFNDFLTRDDDGAARGKMRETGALEIGELLFELPSETC